MESERNSLLKVLLVDDEPYIRKGLNALIDWEAEGFRITGEAQNGDNAIQLLQEEKYDLIISDIKMPEMDGIEFITEVKNNKISEAKFVFLSGFYDYQYAKTAITYGCCDYILKPIQKDELLATLRKIIDDYQKEAGGEKNKRICEKAYLDRNLMAMIWGKYDDINVNHVQMKMHFMEDVTYIHCEISLKDDRFSRLSEEKRGEQQRKLYNCAGLLMKKQADHIIFGVTKQAECYDIGVIYNSAMAREKGLTDEEWLNWFLKELSERIGLMIVACAGSKVKRIEDLAGSYREAMMTRFFRAFPKNDKKIASLSNKKDAVTKNSQEKYYRKDWDSLIHAIEIGDKQLIRDCVRIIYRRMMDNCMDTDLIGMNIHYFLYRLLGLACEVETGINQEEVMQYIQDSVFTSGAIHGNEIKLLKFAEEYADYLMQIRQTTVKGTINKIEAEIEGHFADNLSLKSLGEKYFINSAYLGQIFKKQYGCTFKDYLNGIRIRKAAEMLLRTDEKVYEIAEKVGYKNLEYFINKFENIYGATPTRFRKRSLES